MPGLVGGFGKINISMNIIKKHFSTNKELETQIELRSKIGSYLAGLIESDGTIAVHDENSNTKKYNPKIAVVFNLADEPLAKKLASITNAGTIYKKEYAGHVLWQIQKLEDVIKIINIINGYMRTPKIEALNRTIHWLNDYITSKKDSKLPSTISILSRLNLNSLIEIKPLDYSEIDSNSWLSGFTDADGNFSINIHKRWNKNSTRVQLAYRIEVRQNYHKLDNNMPVSYFNIMSKISVFLGVNLYSRSRIIKDKIFSSFIVVSHNKNSLLKTISYFDKFPLLSSKYLDYKDWKFILDLQNTNKLTTIYLNEAIKVKNDFNSKRTTYNWDHLKNCYIK